MIATIWEVWNDRHGDFNKQIDVVIRINMIGIESMILATILNKPLLTSIMLSTAIFFLFFDYIITYILIKNGNIRANRAACISKRANKTKA